MLKPTVKRGLMLDFIPDEIITPANVNPNRIIRLNNNKIKDGDIIYVMSRDLRLEDNWAVHFGLELAKLNDKIFKILIKPQKYSKKQEPFLIKGINLLKKNLAQNNIKFELSNKIPKNTGALIFDFNPTYKAKFHLNCAAFEIDSHNIIPARFISQKQEYSAATLRRKIYTNIAEFLTEYPNEYAVKYNLIDEFIKNKLDYYAEFKNNPNNDITSNLSPYLHFGFISSHRVALEIIQSKTSRENKEAFLEELIVRKELADNFCLYAKSFNTLESIPNWAKETLNMHRNDIRTYIYSLDEFETCKTHDKIWNKIQQDLIQTGKIHGYLRMYWGKKILEWTKSPEDALNIAIYLNDKYALDGNDPNGYVGILWCIGGLHDRPFTNRFVTGKIRYISRNKLGTY